MADQPKPPVVTPPVSSPATAAEPKPHPTSPVKAVANWFRNKTSSSLKSIKSQLKQFIAPDGSRINMAMLPNNVAVFTAKNSNGDLVFNQAVGTKKSAKGKHFIAFTPLPDIGHQSGRWILGSITESTTSRKRAAATKFTENWHNFIFHKALNGPYDWQTLVGTGRSINLALGTSWCIIKLNVPVTELDISISSPEGQTLTHVISPARQVIGTVDQDNTAQEEGAESNPAEPDQIDLLYDADDAVDIFSDPNDRDTSNSHHSSGFLTPDGQTEGVTVVHDSDEITLPDLTPHPVSQAEKANNISSWIQG